MLPLIVLLATAQSKTGTITLHVTDPKGKPVIGEEIQLLNPDTFAMKGEFKGPLRPYGFLPMVGDHYGDEVSSAKTDRAGNVRFEHLRRSDRFGVTAVVGHQTRMFFYGSVKVGEIVHVIVRHDCHIIGKVSASPLSRFSVVGLRMSLVDSPASGGMHPFADRPIRTTKTDANGYYHFDGLPACDFEVDCGNPRGAGRGPITVDYRIDNGAWRNESAYVSGEEWSDSGAALPYLRKRSTHCDFRLGLPAVISVNLANPTQAALLPGTLMVGDQGFDLGTDHKLRFPVTAGAHSIKLVTRPSDYKQGLGDSKKTLATVTVKEGEVKQVTVTIPTRPEAKKPRNWHPQGSLNP